MNLFDRRKQPDSRGVYISHKEGDNITVLLFFCENEQAHSFTLDLDKRGVAWRVHRV